ncbi:hypothetical protein ABZ442_04980 [Streptomyces triculaminicus]|uniref:hypothetical protein n=1 Tax=Streptomyces triculaminicus TaxID=2816232 RepID=UPI0033F326BF
MNWPNLTWRKATWTDRTYHATSKNGTYKYTVDHDGMSWRLRTWRTGTVAYISFETAESAAALQQIADDHAGASA